MDTELLDDGTHRTYKGTIDLDADDPVSEVVARCVSDLQAAGWSIGQVEGCPSSEDEPVHVSLKMMRALVDAWCEMCDKEVLYRNLRLAPCRGMWWTEEAPHRREVPKILCCHNLDGDCDVDEFSSPLAAAAFLEYSLQLTHDECTALDYVLSQRRHVGARPLVLSSPYAFDDAMGAASALPSLAAATGVLVAELPGWEDTEHDGDGRPLRWHVMAPDESATDGIRLEDFASLDEAIGYAEREASRMGMGGIGGDRASDRLAERIDRIAASRAGLAPESQDVRDKDER